MYRPKKEFMYEAIEEAKKARNAGDYAIGAIIEKDEEIIAMGENRIKIDNNPIFHAEIVAIQKAAIMLRDRHLENCVLYTTHEPCPMCTSAAIWARMKGIVYGARIEDMYQYGIENWNDNFSWRTIQIPASIILEKGKPRLFLIRDFMREECKKLFHP